VTGCALRLAAPLHLQAHRHFGTERHPVEGLAVLTRAVPTSFASILFLYDDALASRRRGSIELRHVCVWHARGRVVWVKKDMRASATMSLVIEVLLENTFCEDTF
jgi:hypothetical protein